MLSNAERPDKYADNGSVRDRRSRDDSRDRNRDRRDREQEHSDRRKQSRSRSNSRKRNEDYRRNSEKNRDVYRDSKRPLDHQSSYSRNSSRNDEETNHNALAATSLKGKNDETNQQHSTKRRDKKKHDDHCQYTWGKQEEIKKTENEEEEKKEPEYKPDFGLSGALAKDEKTGNVLNGQVLKFTEPYEAAMPDKKWRLYVYKENDLLDTLHLHRRSCFLIGRDTRVADIHILHPSSSLQHAVIQFRGIEKKMIVDGERVKKVFIKPYIMDLTSTHGTYLNGEKIEDARYYELREKDLLKFGSSTRDYILLHDNSNTEDEEES